MLKFQIKEQLYKNGITTPHTFLVQKCGINPNSATRLLNGKQSSLRLEHISTICALVGCTPNDLLYWDDTIKNYYLKPEHKIYSELSPPPVEADWTKMITYLDKEDRTQLFDDVQAKLKDKGYGKNPIPPKK